MPKNTPLSRADLKRLNEIINNPSTIADQKRQAMKDKISILLNPENSTANEIIEANGLCDQLLAMADLSLEDKLLVNYYKAKCLTTAHCRTIYNPSNAISIYKELLKSEFLEQYKTFKLTIMINLASIYFSPDVANYRAAFSLYAILLEEDDIKKNDSKASHIIDNCVSSAVWQEPPDINLWSQAARLICPYYKTANENTKRLIEWRIVQLREAAKKITNQNNPELLNFRYHLAILVEELAAIGPRAIGIDNDRLLVIFKANPTACLSSLYSDDKLNLETKITYLIKLFYAMPNSFKDSKLIITGCNLILDYIEQQRKLMKNQTLVGPSSGGSDVTHKITEDDLIPYFEAIEQIMTTLNISDKSLIGRFTLNMCQSYLENNRLWDVIFYLNRIKDNNAANRALASLLFRTDAATLTPSFQNVVNKNALILLLFSRADNQLNDDDITFLNQSFIMLKNNISRSYNTESLHKNLGVDKVISFNRLLEIAETTLTEITNIPNNEEDNKNLLLKLITEAKNGFTPEIASKIINHPNIQKKLTTIDGIKTANITTIEDLVVCPDRYPISNTTDLLKSEVKQFTERLTLIDTFWNESNAYLDKIRQEQLINIKTCVEETFKSAFKNENIKLAKSSLFASLYTTEKDAAIELFKKCQILTNSSDLIDVIIQYIQNDSLAKLDPASFKLQLIKALNTKLNLAVEIPKQVANKHQIKEFITEFCNSLASIKMDNPDFSDKNILPVSAPQGFHKVGVEAASLLIVDYLDTLNRIKTALEKTFPVKERESIFENMAGKKDLELIVQIINKLTRNPNLLMSSAQVTEMDVNKNIRESIADISYIFNQLRGRIRGEQYLSVVEKSANILEEFASKLSAPEVSLQKRLSK